MFSGFSKRYQDIVTKRQRTSLWCSKTMARQSNVVEAFWEIFLHSFLYDMYYIGDIVLGMKKT